MLLLSFLSLLPSVFIFLAASRVLPVDMFLSLCVCVLVCLWFCFCSCCFKSHARAFHERGVDYFFSTVASRHHSLEEPRELEEKQRHQSQEHEQQQPQQQQEQEQRHMTAVDRECPPHRVVVLQRSAGHRLRSFANMPDVTRVIEEVTGVSPVLATPDESMPLGKQAEVLRGAGLVVSSHSSQLYGFAWMHPGSGIVEAVPVLFNVHFPQGAEQFGHHYRFAFGGSTLSVMRLRGTRLKGRRREKDHVCACACACVFVRVSLCVILADQLCVPM